MANRPSNPGDNSQTPSVIIAGGGPAGLWLACELALANVRVTVLERLAQPTGLSKALGLHPRTMEMFDHRGIADRFADGNPAPPFLNFGLLPLDLRTLDFPHPYGVVIPQARVEQLLEEQATARGVDIRRGHDVTGLRQDAYSVTVDVRTADHEYQLTAPYLVGCDGAHSLVRKELGIAFPGADPTIVGRMGDIKLSQDAIATLERDVPELNGRAFGVARTKTGNFAIVPLGPEVYRVAAIEWGDVPSDYNSAMPLDELRGAIRRVIGKDLPIEQPLWLSRATDSSRLVERYRVGRVLLAGDAAHIHWAYGGMGLQTGLQDVGNLGWKLAAEVHGWAPPDLLDSYHTERHEVGRRVLTATRAQEALARPGNHVTALRELVSEWLKNSQIYGHICEMITGVEIRYPMDAAETHPQLGRWAPDLSLMEGRKSCRLADLMHGGKAVLLNLGARASLHQIATGWADRVHAITARCLGHPAGLDALLIRPDGYVAWVAHPADTEDELKKTLSNALRKWFGAEN